MNLAQEIDFNSLMEPVALRLLGEPAQKHGHEWRYGNRGSLSIDIAKGQWFDHEANAGGGVFDLIKRQGHEQPAAWLRREGLLTTPQVVGRPQPRIVKAYPYCDENGTLLFQVVRYEPKGFRQRRPDGRGGWIWNLQDTRHVPYLLPELVKAVAAGETIYVPEGEKDADNLRAIGFAATTNPGGCKKWRTEYSEQLRGADVVVLPDNHLDGREHGDQVVASLRGIASRIRVLDIGKHWAECPNKSDISDWLAAGGSAEKLKAVVDTLPEVPTSADNKVSRRTWRDDTFSAADLQKETFPPLAWILRDIIPAEGVGLLCSKPKFGKSWFVLDLCLGCTADHFILGTIKPKQGDVLYLALEDSKRRLQRRMTKLLPTFGAKWPERLTIKINWRRLHEGGLDDIRAWHDATKKAGGKPILVVVDVLAKVRKPTGNRQLYEADYEALTGLTKLANELSIAILVVHHVRKLAADDLMETVSGSFGTTGAVDTVLVMANRTNGAVLDIRGRDVEAAELAIEFSKTTCRWKILGKAAEVHVSEQRARILGALKEANSPLSIAALMEATGMKRNSLELLLGRMAKEREILRVAKGHYAHKDYVPPPDPSHKRRAGSVASVGAQTDARQIQSCAQGAETKEAFGGICLPVRSVQQLTDGNGSDLSVQTQTDETDRQMAAQVPEITTEFARKGSVSGSDRSDRSDRSSDDCPVDPFDVGLNPWPRCRVCGRPGGVEWWDLDGQKIPLHDGCQPAWADNPRS
jgi:AAA domain